MIRSTATSHADIGLGGHSKDEGPRRTPLAEQVLAWLITSRGRAAAITVDADGHVGDADGADAFIPPGEDRGGRAAVAEEAVGFVQEGLLVT
ncbi:hypothetical protein [Streptomyces alboniger]|uniref:Uncharacterized protein n=1 Tax=Streptomyces alboniger TaxID=132473 RepID=A0A5J6HDW0_STRAD|nr:hypothetical protein [Streptomyces alboniger]QEV16603.1 hypothetical protein CP975_02990 [Streptomyces alboniger]